MSDAGIHGDNEVEIRYQRRGIGKILQLRAEVKNIAAASQHGGIAVADLTLHTDECRIDPTQERQKNRSSGIDRLRSLLWLGSPDQASPIRGRCRGLSRAFQLCARDGGTNK